MVERQSGNGLAFFVLTQMFNRDVCGLNAKFKSQQIEQIRQIECK